MRRTLSALCAAAAIAVAADAAEDTMLVLDGSGSMWGRAGGQVKLLTARGAIGEALGQLPAERRLGLVSYGHTLTEDCGDVAVLAQPGTDRAPVRQAVNTLNPTGVAPLSSAVERAAEALNHTEQKATVVVIADGGDNCRRNPCQVAEALEADGADFTAHVIGFHVDRPGARAHLQCLAERTGGRYVEANSADSLSNALLASFDIDGAVLPDPTPAPAPAPAASAEPPPDPRLRPQVVAAAPEPAPEA
ncbi:MAG: VWA domain-containing protein, partial [Caulobacterales bacterium]|nr:VWA domain-containing protein [Caulobacterales bacterium]